MSNLETPTEQNYSLADAVLGRNYATESVTVYTDEDAAKRLIEHQEQIKGVELNESEKAQSEDLTQRLLERLLKSALTWEFKGIAPKWRDVILKPYDLADPEQAVKAQFELTFKHVTAVKDSEGNMLQLPKDLDSFSDILLALPDSEAKKITEAVNQLSFKSGFVDQAVGAGFLQKP